MKIRFAAKRIISFLLMLTIIFTVLSVSLTASAATMTVSSVGVDLIKSFEGFYKYQYWDHQQWTIGYGTRCSYNEFPNGITVEQATERLRYSLATVEKQLNDFLNKNNIKVNQNQYDALVSFAYNVGEYIWYTDEFFTLRNYLKDGISNHTAVDFEYAFGLWVYAGGQVAPGLVTRRQAEAELFNTPIITVPAAPKNYSIKYNANGGSSVPVDQYKFEGETAKISDVIPIKEGYTFLGWATAPDGAVVYKSGDSYSANANLTLYAVWIKYETVKYSANGGTDAPQNQEKIGGQSIKLSTARPKKTGYTFIGWSTTQNATAAQYAPGAKYNGSDVTLYAVWQKMKPVSFAVDGAAYGDVDQNGIVDDVDLTKLKAIVSDKTELSAQVKTLCDVDLSGKVDEYDVYVLQNYLSGTLSALPARYFNADGKYTSLPRLSAEGLYFIGWSTDEQGSNVVNSNTSLTDSVMLYPVWSDTPAKGDINGDGVVTVTDILLLRNLILADQSTMTAEQFNSADVDCNASLTVSDILATVGIIQNS